MYIYIYIYIYLYIHIYIHFAYNDGKCEIYIRGEKIQRLCARKLLTLY